LSGDTKAFFKLSLPGNPSSNPPDVDTNLLDRHA